MGFFQKLEDLVFGKPVTCHDELFGTLEFDRPSSTWNSLKPIAIGTGDAFVAVNAGPDGPTDEQRQRFREFVARWADLKSEISPLAYEELKGWFDGSWEWYTKCNDAASLATIPHLTAEGQVWDYLPVSYVRITEKSDPDDDFFMGIEFFYLDRESDAEHIMHVAIRDWHVRFLGIEG